MDQLVLLEFQIQMMNQKNVNFYALTANGAVCAVAATILSSSRFRTSGLNMWSGALPPRGPLTIVKNQNHLQRTELPSSRRSQDPPDTGMGPGILSTDYC